MIIGRFIGNNISMVNKFLSYFNILSVIVLAFLVIAGFLFYKVKKSKKT